MWRCQQCGELVDDDEFERCWNCSATRPDLRRISEGAPESLPRRSSRRRGPPDDSVVAVVEAIRRGVRAVVAHPAVVVACGPALLWEYIERGLVPKDATFLSLIHAPFAFVWPVGVVVRQLTSGFVYAYLATVARDRSSVSGAAMQTLRQAPALVAVAAVGWGAMLGLFSAATMLGRFFLARWIFPVIGVLFGYVSVRLAFWSVSIVTDDRGVIDGARFAWRLAEGNWWRLAALSGLSGAAHWVGKRWIASPHVAVATMWLLGITGEAALAMAYLQRIGRLPRPRSRLGDVVARSISAAAGRAF